MVPKDPTAFDEFDASDWRRRPRRDATGVRNHRLSIRVTENEMRAIEELAAQCEMPVNDFVVCRVLHRKNRVHPDNDLRA